MSDTRQSLSDLGGMQDGSYTPAAREGREGREERPVHTGGGGPPAPLRDQEIDA